MSEGERVPVPPHLPTPDINQGARSPGGVKRKSSVSHTSFDTTSVLVRATYPRAAAGPWIASIPGCRDGPRTLVSSALKGCSQKGTTEAASTVCQGSVGPECWCNPGALHSPCWELLGRGVHAKLHGFQPPNPPSQYSQTCCCSPSPHHSHRVLLPALKA